MAVITNPGGIYALCPHCKRENVELKVKFMIQCAVVKCKICHESFTWEMLNLPGPNGTTQTITNVSPFVKEIAILGFDRVPRVSDLAKEIENDIKVNQGKG